MTGGFIMSLKKMKKEELELLSNKDIAYMILEDRKRTINTADLFKKIIDLLELPESTFEKKIADFYTALSTDKRFILLDDGRWDLRNRHSSEKRVKYTSDEEDDEEEEELEEDTIEEEIEEDEFDDTDDDSYQDDDTNEDLKDLVVIDEDELELEE
jgi:DNA-directed RNA polymerase subunit delta